MKQHPDERPGAPVWRQGWLHGARRRASPNFGPRPADACVDLIVLHSISLPPGRYGGHEVLDFFCNTLDCAAHPYFGQLRGVAVSAHFFLRRDGTLWQCVSGDDRAWHAGASRFRGRDNCNDDSIGIELEGLEGERFEPAQYAALAGLCRAIAARYPVRNVAGHEHIAPGRKFDPGPGFDWEQLRSSLGWPREWFAA